MDVPAIVEALRMQPFEPFVMQLADGRKFEIRHPEFVAAHPRRVIVVHDDASWSVVEPVLIRSLESPAIGGKRGNGSPKKKRPKDDS